MTKPATLISALILAGAALGAQVLAGTLEQIDVKDGTTFSDLQAFGAAAPSPDARAAANDDDYLALSGALTHHPGVGLAPVPESETWAMLIGGLGLLAALARRPRQDVH